MITFKLPTAIILASLLSAAACIYESGQSKLTLINDASEPIANLVVYVCDKSVIVADNVMPHQKVEAVYTSISDCHYSVRGQFQSGNKIDKDIGYITNGFDFIDSLTVTQSDVLLINEKAMRTKFEWPFSIFLHDPN